MGVLRDAIATGIERWVMSRNPPRREVILGQKQIFIMPNRYGAGLLTLVVLLFVMGTNYQNNLVLALAFWLLSVFVLSILLTYFNLAGLILRAGEGEPGHVNCPVRHRMSVHSPQARFGLMVTGRPVPGRPAMTSVEPDDHWLEAVASGATETLTMTCLYAQRGEHAAPRVRLDTRFPFGWITAWVFWNPLQSATVWPAAIDHGVIRSTAAMPSGRQSTLPDHDDLDDLRAYARGDSPRRIIWRHYARRGELYVKTPPTRAEGETELLDIAQVAGLPLEAGLEQLAFWLLQCEARELRWSLRLGSFSLPPGQGAVHRRAALDALAVFAPGGGGHAYD